MPSIGADAHPIAFGDFGRAYVLADRGGLRVTIDDNVTQPGRVRWYIRRRVGGVGYDDRAVRFAKCAAS
jgi:HK97 family phage major capsid protein